MLEVEDLTVERGAKTIVSGVSLEARPGKVLAILGANGAGKSELVLTIAGMMRPSTGHIRLDGRSIANLTPELIRKSGVVAVPEGHRVLTRLSVEDNLRAAGSVLAKQDVQIALGEVFELFPELAERKRQLAGTMSGGQQQMLAIGHALMANPRLLLIDEMSLGLAPLIVKRLMAAVRCLKEKGLGLVIVEQYAEVALALADSAMVMRLGKVTFNGSAAELRDRPQDLHAAYFDGNESDRP